MAELFIQYPDGTTESIPVTPGPTSRQVILARAPRVPLSLLLSNYARALFVFSRTGETNSRPYLLTERQRGNKGSSSVKAINYNPNYYAHDLDYVAPESYPWSISDAPIIRSPLNNAVIYTQESPGSILVEGSGLPDCTTNFEWDGVILGSITSGPSGGFTTTIEGLIGDHILRVNQTPPNGETAWAQVNVTVKLRTISVLAPIDQPREGEEWLVIYE